MKIFVNPTTLIDAPTTSAGQIGQEILSFQKQHHDSSLRSRFYLRRKRDHGIVAG